jgi:hypothetical protein
MLGLVSEFASSHPRNLGCPKLASPKQALVLGTLTASATEAVLNGSVAETFSVARVRPTTPAR